MTYVEKSTGQMGLVNAVLGNIHNLGKEKILQLKDMPTVIESTTSRIDLPVTLPTELRPTNAHDLQSNA